jgi:hypothetical protein
MGAREWSGDNGLRAGYGSAGRFVSAACTRAGDPALANERRVQDDKLSQGTERAT